MSELPKYPSAGELFDQLADLLIEDPTLRNCRVCLVGRKRLDSVDKFEVVSEPDGSHMIVIAIARTPNA